jgi:hypothetical protein
MRFNFAEPFKIELQECLRYLCDPKHRLIEDSIKPSLSRLVDKLDHSDPLNAFEIKVLENISVKMAKDHFDSPVILKNCRLFLISTGYYRACARGDSPIFRWYKKQYCLRDK